MKWPHYTYMWNIILPHPAHSRFHVIQVLVSPTTQLEAQGPVGGHHRVPYGLTYSKNLLKYILDVLHTNFIWRYK